MLKKRIISFFFVFIFLNFSFLSSVFAQGSCDARYEANKCKIILPHGCDDGYSPQARQEKVGPIIVCPCSCVEAGISNPLITGELASLSGTQFLNKFLSLALSLGFIIAAIAFFLMFIMGGIRWITSAGDKGKVEAARGQITHAIIGLLLTFALYVILGLIEDFFGISLRQFNLPKLTD